MLALGQAACIALAAGPHRSHVPLAPPPAPRTVKATGPCAGPGRQAAAGALHRQKSRSCATASPRRPLPVAVQIGGSRASHDSDGDDAA